MKARAARYVRPDHFTRRVNVFGTIGKIETQLHLAVGIERRGALDCDSLFADVDNLEQIEHRALGFRGETGIGRSLDLVSHTPATIRGRSQRRGHSCHEERARCLAGTILARDGGKVSKNSRHTRKGEKSVVHPAVWDRLSGSPSAPPNRNDRVFEAWPH